MDEFKGVSPDKPLSQPSEIRVAQILPGSFEGSIRCKLIYICLDRRPDYTTLSYAWDDPAVTVLIELDG